MSLIGNAHFLQDEENKKVFILTDEIMPSTADKDGKVKLNIPSLAKRCNIECKELRDSVNELFQ